MTPGKYNFTCPQGTTFTRTITYKIGGVAVNLTGYTARMQVRKFASDTNPLATATGVVIPASGSSVFTVLVGCSATAVSAGDGTSQPLLITPKFGWGVPA